MKNRNAACRGGGGGVGDYEECMGPPSFTFSFFSELGRVLHITRRKSKMGDMRRGSKRRGGVGKTGVVKTKTESGYCKE